MSHFNLLELAIEFGLSPKKTSATNGGEYHSPCPKCGGKDRFIIWIETERYWCRQCEVRGDAIQFCRDFLGMSFLQSSEKVSSVFLPRKGTFYSKSYFEPQLSEIPSNEWIQKASNFIRTTHSKALTNPHALNLLKERGFSLETVKNFQLGWNDYDPFEDVKLWGISSEESKKIWLPQGLVIPTFCQGHPIKIKIRRSTWKELDSLPKYVEIRGSQKTPSIYGDCLGCLVLLESELDAILLQQCASTLCTSMAVGSTKRRPDLRAHKQVLTFDKIFFSLDFDDAGKQAFKFWKNLYPHLIAWPSPRGKSVGDAFKLGVDLYRWIESGLRK